MRKLLQSTALLTGLLFLPSLAHAAGLEDCSPLQVGYIRDGFTPNCGQLLKVNPDGSINVLGSITPSGTQDVNLKQVGGVTTAVGSGVLNTGTQRVVLATDQPAVAVTDGPVATNTSTTATNTGTIATNTAPLLTDAVQADISFTANGQSTIFDAGAAGGVSLAVSGTWNLTFQVQWSNKVGGPWTAGTCWSAGNVGTSPAVNIIGNGQYGCPKFGRYANITSTAYTSGTAVVTPALLAQRPGYPATTSAGTIGTAADGGTLTTAQRVESIAKVFNGATEDLWRSVVNGLNGQTGIGEVGLTAQCDDVSPVAIGENSWGNARLGCLDHSQLAGGLNTAGLVKGLALGPVLNGLYVDPSAGAKVTYHYDGSYTPYATPTDVLCVNGSASKTVKLTSLTFRPLATAASVLTPSWIKRSTANTGGTPTSRTAFAVDSASAAVTGTITEYAAAPTPGSTVGTLASYQTTEGALATGSSSNNQFYGNSAVNLMSPLAGFSQFPTLRGVAEGVCLNFAGAAMPGGTTWTYTVEFTEE